MQFLKWMTVFFVIWGLIFLVASLVGQFFFSVEVPTGFLFTIAKVSFGLTAAIAAAAGLVAVWGMDTLLSWADKREEEEEPPLFIG